MKEEEKLRPRRWKLLKWEFKGSNRRADPYEILLLAAPFLIGGVLMLFRNVPAHLYDSNDGDTMWAKDEKRNIVDGTLNVRMVHNYGVVGIVIGVSLVCLYLYVRRRMRRVHGEIRR